MSKPVSYILAIFEPGSDKDTLYSGVTETVFPKLSKGEILTFPSLDLNTRYKIVEIEYAIWETENLISCQTKIFTEEVKR